MVRLASVLVLLYIAFPTTPPDSTGVELAPEKRPRPLENSGVGAHSLGERARVLVALGGYFLPVSVRELAAWAKSYLAKDDQVVQVWPPRDLPEVGAESRQG